MLKIIMEVLGDLLCKNIAKFARNKWDIVILASIIILKWKNETVMTDVDLCMLMKENWKNRNLSRFKQHLWLLEYRFMSWCTLMQHKSAVSVCMNPTHTHTHTDSRGSVSVTLCRVFYSMTILADCPLRFIALRFFWQVLISHPVFEWIINIINNLPPMII